jgi:hypothetical protein
MTLVSRVQTNFHGTMEIWKLDSPATGANNVVCSVDTGVSPDALILAVALDWSSYTSVGAGQTSSGFTTTPSVGSIASEDSAAVVDAMLFETTTETGHGSGQAEEEVGTQAQLKICVSLKTGTVASESVSNTLTANSDWNIAGVSVFGIAYTGGGMCGIDDRFRFRPSQRV